MTKNNYFQSKRIKGFIFAFFLTTCISKATTSVSDITNRLYDMEGQIVQVEIRKAYNPHQTSREEYEFNISSGEQVAIVVVPAEKGIKWFPNGKMSPMAPAYIMVKVSHGPIQNQFGATREGPVLYWVDK
jgi:hypothetical protein